MFKQKPKYYSSIHDCPIGIWHKVSKTSDLDHLRISGKGNPEAARLAYDSIQIEYVETFGIPDGYKMYLEQSKRALSEYAKGQLIYPKLALGDSDSFLEPKAVFGTA